MISKSSSTMFSRSLVALWCLALFALSVASCVYQATEVIVIVDTNAPSSRLTTLSATVHGAAGDGGPAHVWVRGDGVPGGIQLPASFAVVPASQLPLEAPVTLVLDLNLAPGSAGEPASHFQRIARFQFTRQRTTVLRVYLPIECGALATGCDPRSTAPCTVARQCEDRGQTCGDNATCVSAVVTPIPLNGNDASVTTTDRPDIVIPPPVDVFDAAPADVPLDADDAGDVSDVGDLDAADADAGDAADSGSCATGEHLCSGSCVTDNDVLHCGTACSPCPTPAHASPSCDGASCGFVCDANFADCNSSAADGCETDLSLASTCGTCTTTCGSSAPVCAPSGGGFACATGCPSGTTLCGSSCVTPDSDPSNCGSCGNACPAPADGRATCSGSMCGFVCNVGFHACGGACVANNSTASCGGSCTPCDTPTNGSATCDGVSCGFGCDPGFHACGSACVTNSSVTSCGSACSPCAAPANATATCDGATCGFSCLAGFADCDGMAANGCETNLGSAATCGSCGTSCSGGTPLCAGSPGAYSCVSGCPTGQTLCSSSCVDTTADTANCGGCGMPCAPRPNATASCSGSACNYVCNAGFHMCGGVCVSASSTASCGASCSPCVIPSNATATCDGTSCGFVCNSGFHNCGGVCVSNSDVATCGNACSPCGAPPNATATCDGSSCGFVCNSGFHNCGGLCVSNASVSNCGSSCSPCAAPANSSATCNGVSCGYSCVGRFDDCNGLPFDGCETDLNTSTSNCGGCRIACVARPNSSPTCSGGGCGYTCDPGMADCDGIDPTGCETNLSNDPGHCGSCGNVCNLPQAAPFCSGGNCGIAGCAGGWFDVDGDPGDGCECPEDGNATSCGGGGVGPVGVGGGASVGGNLVPTGNHDWFSVSFDPGGSPHISLSGPAGHLMNVYSGCGAIYGCGDRNGDGVTDWQFFDNPGDNYTRDVPAPTNVLVEVFNTAGTTCSGYSIGISN